MKAKEELTEKIRSELIENSKTLSSEEFKSFLEWMVFEYRNYMMLSRINALKTLDLLLEMCPDYVNVVNVLKNNMDEYASLQCYHIASTELKNQLK